MYGGTHLILSPAKFGVSASFYRVNDSLTLGAQAPPHLPAHLWVHKEEQTGDINFVGHAAARYTRGCL